MLKVFFYMSLVLLLISCGSDSANENGNGHDNDMQLTFNDELIDAIKKQVETCSADSLFANNSEAIEIVYSENSFHPYWLDEKSNLTKEAADFSEILYHTMHYGLDTNRYNTILIRESIEKAKHKENTDCAITDVLLTNLYFKLAKDLHIGIVDTSLYKSEFGHKEFKIDVSANFAENSKKNNLVSALLQMQPPIAEYQKLQKGLRNFLNTHAIVDSNVTVDKYTSKHSKEDSIRIYNQAREALVIHDYIDSFGVLDSVFFKALKAFQINHGLVPDAKIGKNTANALSGNPTEFYRRAAVSLEKWRWVEPDSLEDEYIFANIATYKLKLYRNEELKQEHKVVVGAYATQTPELDSEIEYMIAYPFWTVPYSIKTNELIPKSRKDSTYLERNNYQLLKGGKVVEMSSVDWENINANNFNYTVRQKGGNSNALGVIKFIFPNKHSVYFHDTPSKGKFENDIRAYSHGCVRVDEPLKLAEFLLAREGEVFHIDSVKATINRRERKTITLKKNMPVHIRYYSAEGDTNGNVLFYPDIYGREKELEKIMFFSEEKTLVL